MSTIIVRVRSRLNYKIWVLSVLAALFAYSCDLENLITDQDEYLVTEEEALSYAQNLLFTSRMPRDTTTLILTKEDYTERKNIENITPIYAEQRDPVFYIINFNQGGFVLLSADKRMDPVLAYSYNNRFLRNQESHPPGLVDWLEEIAQIIIDIRRENGRATEEVEKKWVAVLQPVSIDFLGILFCPDEDYIAIKILLETEWGQGCGFNENLEDSCSSRCNRPPVGCVATAVAQIAKYHADRSNTWNGTYTLANTAIRLGMDWAGMPLTGVDENNHGDIHYLMADLGPLLKMDYSCSGSGANINDAHATLKNNFPFSNATKRDLKSAADYSVVLNDIKNNRPVYMRGRTLKSTEILKGEIIKTYSGHAWVADGYSQMYDCEAGFLNDYMIHMNWGWGGSSDGFFIKKEGKFEEDRIAIHNIRVP
jgi:hypothetical protein